MTNIISEQIYKMTEYNISYYWSDSNTFATEIENYTIESKDIDSCIEQIKNNHALDETVKDQISDLGTDPINLGIDLVYDANRDEQITIQEFNCRYPEIDLSDDLNENMPYIRFYGWEINETI